jgi:hypothetical protein
LASTSTTSRTTTVVERVAGRGYVTTTTSRAKQLEAGGSPFGIQGSTTGGIYLTPLDEADLRKAVIPPENGDYDSFTIKLKTPRYGCW